MTAPARPPADAEALFRALTTAVATGEGVHGIASALHQVTGGAVVIEDGEGSRLASAGDPVGELPDRLPSNPEDHARAVRVGDWLLAAVRPGADFLGAVGLHDPQGRAGDAELQALEQGALVLATELYRLRSVAANELRVWGDLATELLDNPDIGRARSHLAALGYRIDGPHRAVVIEATGAAGLPSMSAVHRAFRAAGTDGRLITRRADEIVCLVDGSGNLLRLVAELRGLGPSGLRLGIGDAHESDDLGLSVGEAELALRLSGTDVALFDELGIASFLSADADVTRLRAFVDHWLGTLEDYDREHTSDLVHSLERFLEGGQSARATAEGLHIHASTLKYRLRRIQELTGRNLHDPDTRFNLDLACRIRSTLQAQDGPVSPVSSAPCAGGDEADGPAPAPTAYRRVAPPVEVAILDQDGVLTSVNQEWVDFCIANGGDPERAGVGTSYLGACTGAAGDRWADLAASLVRLAVDGELPAPARLTIPCHGPDVSRWFDMTVASRHDDKGGCCGAEITLTPTAAH